MCYLFGLRKEVSIRNYMIQTQIEGATYYYGIDDVSVAERFTGVKVWNCFDYENLDHVHLFDGDKYLGTFDRITPAQQYGPNKDMRAVGKVKAIGKKMDDARAERITKSLNTFDEPEGNELGAMLSGKTKKHEYEAAETATLKNEWDEEGEITIDIRNHY